MFSVSKIIAVFMWMFFVTITQHVQSKLITVNNNGNSSTGCCTNGNCLCNSLYDALESIESGTTIIITSKYVSLDDNAYIGVKDLNNVTTKGDDVVVMCNNKGGMFWRSGDNIVIQGITWDQCGNPRYPPTVAIKFDELYSISIVRCTFQYSKVCQTVYLVPAGYTNVYIHVVNTSFISNGIENATGCFDTYGSIIIQDYQFAPTETATIIISGSMFYTNKSPIQYKEDGIFCGTLNFNLYEPLAFSIMVENSSFSSNEIIGALLINNAFYSQIAFNDVTVFNNNQGGIKIVLQGSMTLDIASSTFSQNSNGALVLDMHGYDSKVEFSGVTFVRNKGSYDSQGTALYIMSNGKAVINFNKCNFDSNIATNGHSIVYIASQDPSLEYHVTVSMNSSRFVDNLFGSALRTSRLILTFDSLALFQSNSAEAGSAIYAEPNSLITVGNASLVHLVKNTASLHGVAIYSDLSNCFSNGVLFSNISNFNSFTFINNTARISGNSIYFNIPTTCNVERDHTKNSSVAYIPYKFKYIQEHDIGPPIATTPYKVNLCSPHNYDTINENCFITEQKMLGESVYLSAIVYGYFNAVAEPVQFQLKCNNCSTEYRLLNNEILINSKSPNKFSILATNTYNDVIGKVNITLELSSVLSDNYKELSARLSLTLSPCYNGFLFSIDLQKCECDNSGGDDIVQCQEDHAEIKQGYWYGFIIKKHAASLCPIRYCDFNHRMKTRSDYYVLPGEADDQCTSHRTGVVCSDCKPGYTLAYDSFDCVNVNQCSPGMTVLVILLTFLYWVIIVIILFTLSYYFSNEVSSGYFNGIIYFYSIVDILLASNLYVIDGLFYTVAILSSFVKLTPQFLGGLCVAKGLDAIDQQFIHYSHALCISFIFIGIFITAKCFNKVAFYVNHHVTRVTFLFLVLSYTSVTSTSLQLLRGI